MFIVKFYNLDYLFLNHQTVNSSKRTSFFVNEINTSGQKGRGLDLETTVETTKTRKECLKEKLQFRS